MEGFRKECPEIPVVSGTAHAGARISLDCVIQVREFERVSEEEDRSVVADKVPVASVCIEFHSEPSDVPFGIGRSSFSGHCREAHEAFGCLAHFREDGCLCPSGYVVCNCECAVCTGPLCVHTSFRNDLPVEMSEFLDKPGILHSYRAGAACSLDVLIVCDRPAVFSCQPVGIDFFVHWGLIWKLLPIRLILTNHFQIKCQCVCPALKYQFEIIDIVFAVCSFERCITVFSGCQQ